MSDPIELTHISGDYWDGLGPITYRINSVPVNLAGAVISMQIRKGRKATDPVLASWGTADNTVEILDADAGVFSIKGRVLTLPQGKLYSDVEVTPAVISEKWPLSECMKWAFSIERLGRITCSAHSLKVSKRFNLPYQGHTRKDVPIIQQMLVFQLKKNSYLHNILYRGGDGPCGHR